MVAIMITYTSPLRLLQCNPEKKVFQFLYPGSNLKDLDGFQLELPTLYNRINVIWWKSSSVNLFHCVIVGLYIFRIDYRWERIPGCNITHNCIFFFLKLMNWLVQLHYSYMTSSMQHYKFFFKRKMRHHYKKINFLKF